MLRWLAWLEIVAATILFVFAARPFLAGCSGRLLGLDCESWAIWSVNLLGPLAILAWVCSAWSLKSRSAKPQVVLALGGAGIMIYWLLHVL